MEISRGLDGSAAQDCQTRRRTWWKTSTALNLGARRIFRQSKVSRTWVAGPPSPVKTNSITCDFVSSLTRTASNESGTQCGLTAGRLLQTRLVLEVLSSKESAKVAWGMTCGVLWGSATRCSLEMSVVVRTECVSATSQHVRDGYSLHTRSP